MQCQKNTKPLRNQKDPFRAVKMKFTTYQKIILRAALGKKVYHNLMKALHERDIYFQFFYSNMRHND